VSTCVLHALSSSDALQFQMPLSGEQQHVACGASDGGRSMPTAMLFPSFITGYYLLESRMPEFKLTESN